MPTTSDDNWKKLGETDPYYGVVSEDHFRSEKLDDEGLAKFFSGGEQDVAKILAACRSVAPDWSPSSVLDFGCGVGRLVIPFAKVCDRVVGVDVSPAMLEQGRNNVDQRGLSNVEWVLSDDALAEVSGSFDLVNSYIVFQHIPVRRGEVIFARLVDLLAAGGVASIHVTINDRSARSRLTMWLRGKSATLNGVANVLRRRPFSEPLMEMNAYSLNRLLLLLNRRGITDAQVSLTNQGGDLGAFLRFRKPVPQP